MVCETADADILRKRERDCVCVCVRERKKFTHPRARTGMAGATPDGNGSSSPVPDVHSGHNQKLSVILFSRRIFRDRAVWLGFKRHDCRHRRLVDGILLHRSF